MRDEKSLAHVYDGWAGYQTSLVNAIKPLTPEQLVWRPTPEWSSVGEIARHVALGELTWFLRMDAPGSAALAERIPAWDEDSHGNRYVTESAIEITEQPDALIHWLEATWEMVGKTLTEWNISDLAKTYRHTWRGDTYAVSYQWTIWRIMAHDIHHGGQLSLMLGMQGIEAFELIDLGGHITSPPLTQVTAQEPL